MSAMMTIFGRQHTFISACESILLVHACSSSDSDSTCENYVAIIVSSMPAVASVLRGKTPLPSWLANLRSRLSNKSSSGFSASDTSVSVSHQSMVGLRPSDQGMVTGHYAGEDGIYLQLYEGRPGGDYELGLVTTEIQGAAGGEPRTSDESIIHKSVAVHQPTRQARPTT